MKIGYDNQQGVYCIKIEYPEDTIFINANTISVTNSIETSGDSIAKGHVFTNLEKFLESANPKNTPDFGLHLRNSDIVGANGIYFAMVRSSNAREPYANTLSARPSRRTNAVI